MRLPVLLLQALILSLFLACGGSALSQSETCTVARVSDGDSITCADGTRVRFLSIDAPELDQGPFGRAAQAYLEAILPEGTEARLEIDVERTDRYDRLLAYVYRPDGRMVNRLMVRQGFAVAYVGPPNVRHVETIRAAADSARTQGLGLWTIEAFECLPSDHRRGSC
mgnify:CR=1 FL=1